MAYSTPARPTTREIFRTVAALLCVLIAAIGAAFGYQLLSSSSSTAAPPVRVVPSEHRGAFGDGAVPSTVWPPYGQAAFVRTGQAEVQAGPNQHAAAIASVAKVMTA